MGDVPLSVYSWLGILCYSNPTSPRSDRRSVTTVTLIHREFVLAPASDVGPMLEQDFRNWRVLLGEDWSQRIGRRVRSCAVHPEYGATRSTLALVQLRDPVQDKYMKPLCPPLPDLLRSPKLYVIKFHEDFTNLQKQMIPVSHVPGKCCNDIYNISSKLYSKKTQPQHVLCAVAKDIRTCLWRAGAALVSRDIKGRWQLLGIGVQGPGCGTPSRYIHVMSYLPWVRSNLKKLAKYKIRNHDDDQNMKKSNYMKNLTIIDNQNGWEGERHDFTTRENHEDCVTLKESAADIDTAAIYPTFEFQPRWMQTKTFWNESFEERHEKMNNDPSTPSLKVIVVPHSHNDPGWLKTFEQYFETKTNHIINNIVQKLQQYPNMTFIWTEISFLKAWWDQSLPDQREALKKWIKEGRLEITTGGWVMPDEACTHIYALIDQLIEGHDWLRRNLDIHPKTGWSIDPFGHGPTVPYLLDKSGFEGTVIQRIHFAWKQWLGHRKVQEFHWILGWSTKKPALIVHNQPLDLYSTKYSCGPHPSICLSYDFRKIPREYTDYSIKHEDITDQNLHNKSKTLIEEYRRIGSLTEHNVVLIPLGDDFRYEHDSEFDAQYVNYMKMFNYINGHKKQFNADVRFGTPSDYFKAMKERHSNIPTLKGDFFVYSDIFTTGKPAYWSGYYTTRPYFKMLTRQFEHQLRTSEIIFTLVLNHIKQNNDHRLSNLKKKLEQFYEQLITARQNYGLFQHHDAITGTSKANVMVDYGTKLFISMNQCIRLQEAAFTAIMIADEKHHHNEHIFLNEGVWDTYGVPVKKLQVSYIGRNKVVLFNPLIEIRTEVISLKSNTSNIRVYDNRKRQFVKYQINPAIDVRADGKPIMNGTKFEISFVVTIPALTAVSFTLEEHVNKSHHCEVFCNNCNEFQELPFRTIFNTNKMMPGDIHLQNKYLALVIDRSTGFLKQIFRKLERKRNHIVVKFGAYRSVRHNSGAYLFKALSELSEEDILQQYSNNLDDKIVVLSGPVKTEIVTTFWPFLIHIVRIYNIDDPVLSMGVFVENIIDLEKQRQNEGIELFMRIQTDIQNGDIPEFYTDQNGFQYQKRVKVEKLGIEANYYPITTMAWLQDESTRLTLITNHAQGSAAFEPGRLELMLDRRTLYDDFRGIGEGVVDNKPTVFHNWLLLEPMAGAGRGRRDADGFGHVNRRHFGPGQREAAYELPSATADYLSRALNYPVNTYLIDSSEAGDVAVRPAQSFVAGFPTGVHLVSLRTLTDDALEQFPSAAAYMVLQRPGRSCGVGLRQRRPGAFGPRARFSGLSVANLTAVSLTGLTARRALAGLSDIRLRPMDIQTFRISFQSCHNCSSTFQLR